MKSCIRKPSGQQIREIQHPLRGGLKFCPLIQHPSDALKTMLSVESSGYLLFLGSRLLSTLCLKISAYNDGNYQHLFANGGLSPVEKKTLHPGSSSRNRYMLVNIYTSVSNIYKQAWPKERNAIHRGNTTHNRRTQHMEAEGIFGTT